VGSRGGPQGLPIPGPGPPACLRGFPAGKNGAGPGGAFVPGVRPSKKKKKAMNPSGKRAGRMSPACAIHTPRFPSASKKKTTLAFRGGAPLYYTDTGCSAGTGGWFVRKNSSGPKNPRFGEEKAGSKWNGGRGTTRGRKVSDQQNTRASVHIWGGGRAGDWETFLCIRGFRGSEGIGGSLDCLGPIFLFVEKFF